MPEILTAVLSSSPIILKPHLAKAEATCFDELILGQSKQANWYQYGFGIPQGPIVNKTVNGHDVREASDFIMRRLGITPLQPLEQQVVSVFVRERNRKIVNQDELVSALERRFSLPVKLVSMEHNDFREQVLILSRTALAIGLHGSIMIMGIFLPPGAALIELYPYAVPSDNYTPYRTMANLEGMALGYAPWENQHEDNNIAYPSRDRLLGGIAHLPEEQQQKILTSKTVPVHVCCEDPYWLFRIYQDTIVDLGEILDLSVKTMQIAREKRTIKDETKLLKAPQIEGVKCAGSTATSITITWERPWNGAPASSYSIWVHQLFKELTSEKTQLEVTGLEPRSEYHFWIRAMHSIDSDPTSPRGEYSEKTVCRTL